MGRIEEFAVVPTSGRITHLLLQAGRLRGQKQVVVPISEIDRLEDKTVYLKLDRKSIEPLPTAPARRKRL